MASFYDQLARFIYGAALEQAQLSLLPLLPPQGHVLVIGGGSGWLLEQILKTGRQLDILYIDAAPAMLQRAKQRYAHFRQTHQCKVTFRLGTEQTLQPQEQFEVIYTPFLLDLFPPRRLQRLMNKLAFALGQNGSWFFADFWPLQQPPPFWQKLLIWGMYAFFGTVSGVKARQLPDYAFHFRALNFQEAYSRSFFKGMVQAKVFVRGKSGEFVS